MARLGRVLSAVVVGASAAILPISVHAQSGGTSVRTHGITPVSARPAARPHPPFRRTPTKAVVQLGGSLTGVVSDERGGPLARRDGVGRRPDRDGDARSATSTAATRSTRCPPANTSSARTWRASPHRGVSRSRRRARRRRPAAAVAADRQRRRNHRRGRDNAAGTSDRRGRLPAAAGREPKKTRTAPARTRIRIPRRPGVSVTSSAAS